MTTGHKANGQWDTKTKFLKKKKSRSRLLREKRERMRRKRLKIHVLKHGFSSRQIQLGRAVAKLKMEMAKKNPIDARIWNYAYSAFCDANEILRQHDRMMRLEKKKIKARLFLASLDKERLPTEEINKKILNSCPKCGDIWFSLLPETCSKGKCNG
jgi:hypothetical protein